MSAVSDGRIPACARARLYKGGPWRAGPTTNTVGPRPNRRQRGRRRDGGIRQRLPFDVFLLLSRPLCLPSLRTSQGVRVRAAALSGVMIESGLLRKTVLL